MAVDSIALARRFVDELWSKGNFNVIDEIVARDVVLHDPSLPDGRGHEDLRALVRTWRGAFPDMTCIAEDVFSSGDRVAIRWLARGTHRGELAGVPATGRTAAMRGSGLLRITNGRISEMYSFHDQLNLLQQLGVVDRSTFSRPLAGQMSR